MSPMSTLTAEQTTTAKELARVAIGLTRKTVSIDEYRAAMRASREQHGEDMHNVLKGHAVASHVRTFG